MPCGQNALKCSKYISYCMLCLYHSRNVQQHKTFKRKSIIIYVCQVLC